MAALPRWWQHSQAEEARLEEEPRDKTVDMAEVDVDEKDVIELQWFMASAVNP